MKSFVLKKIWLISHSEKAGRSFRFDPDTTVVMGENGVGKSALIKSIYHTFGAEPAKQSAGWKRASVLSSVQFSIDSTQYTIIRAGDLFGIFDRDGQKIFAGSGVTSGIGRHLARLLDFNLTLMDRQGNSATPPPAYCFLPFYVDQDKGWSQSWSSFNRLTQFKDFKKDLAHFHSGIHPKEYYAVKGEKVLLDQEHRELVAQLSLLENARDKLVRDRRKLAFDTRPEKFRERLNALLRECDALQERQDAIMGGLSKLSNERAILREQIEIGMSVLGELEADFSFLQDQVSRMILCPTCGTAHENSFSNRFAVITDSHTCRDFIAEAKLAVSRVEKEMAALRAKFDALGFRSARIRRILDEKRGKVTLRELIEGEAERQIEAVFAGEVRDMERAIGALSVRIDQLRGALATYADRKHKEKIEKFYREAMAKSLLRLGVTTISPADVGKIDSHIQGTGNEYPRALLAYYYSFLRTVRNFSSACWCPIVVDTPLQQDPDPVNRHKTMDFVLNAKPPGAQLIVGTTSLHGVPYQGYMIKPTIKGHLLSTDAYGEVAEELAPYYDALIS